ncbi:MAG: CBS domain-containing protein [Planctomycetes bacterium]|nr:CBS domain-containing protein [Planctomycetota bacterium]
MNIKDCMSRDPRGVRTTDRLDAAARVLWEQDCGFVPVLDAVGGLIGVVTDRDLCMASYTQGRALAEIPVLSVMSRQVRAVRPDDGVTAAMAAMQDLQVHRLPVVDVHGRLVGILSTNDLVREAAARPTAIDPTQVLRTLAAIGRARRSDAPTTTTASTVEEPAESAATKVIPSQAATAAKKPATKAKARGAKAGGSKAGGGAKVPARGKSKKG